MTSALSLAKIRELGLDLSDWFFYPTSFYSINSLRKVVQNLKPHQTIKALAFGCMLCGDTLPFFGEPQCQKAECDCRPDFLVDLMVKLPLLQNLTYSLNRSVQQNPPKQLDYSYDTRKDACLGHDGLVYLAGNLSEHKNLMHLDLRGHAYEILPKISLLGLIFEKGSCWLVVGRAIRSGTMSNPFNMRI